MTQSALATLAGRNADEPGGAMPTPHLTAAATAVGARALPAFVGHAALAAVYMLTWREPDALGRGAPDDLRTLWMVELLFLHSLLFLHFAAGHRAALTAALLMYGGIAWVITQSLDTPIVLGCFVWYLAATAWSARRRRPSHGEGGDPEPTEMQLRMWVGYAAAVCLFLGSTMVAMLPFWTHGAWSDRGHLVVISAGVVYFSGRTVLDVVAMTWGRSVSVRKMYLRHRATS